jgi:hypothetical protein
VTGQERQVRSRLVSCDANAACLRLLWMCTTDQPHRILLRGLGRFSGNRTIRAGLIAGRCAQTWFLGPQIYDWLAINRTCWAFQTVCTHAPCEKLSLRHWKQSTWFRNILLITVTELQPCRQSQTRHGGNVPTQVERAGLRGS